MAPNLEQFRQASDEFSLKLYNTISQSSADKSIFLSPLSIHSALLLTYLGADGTTKSEIARSLSLDKSFAGDEKELLEVYGQVLRVFVPSTDEDGNANYELALANKAYVRKGLTINRDFEAAIKEKLNSEVGEVDFQNNLPSAVSEINRWVEHQTRDKIRDLVSTQSLSRDTVLVLVNAIYFKSDWLEQFESYATRRANFTNLNNRNVTVDLMNNTVRAKYTENASFQLLILPYKNNELSMIIVLPKKRNGLKAVEASLTAASLRDECQKAREMKVDVYLPKFKLEQSYELVAVLRQLGITKLFEPEANLSRMVRNVQVAVSGVIHKAFVEVNETGTEAAAATAVMVSLVRCAIVTLPPPIFRADHPFLFAIRHEHTGLLAFLGRVGNLQ